MEGSGKEGIESESMHCSGSCGLTVCCNKCHIYVGIALYCRSRQDTQEVWLAAEPFWACPPPPYTSSRLRMPSMHTSHRARMQTQQRLYALIIYISLACMQWHNQCTASFMLSKG
eukprot:1161992-Pelagomonas_calceolata.AAC.13